MAPSAEAGELRELLARYPALTEPERRELRRLYREARATDVIALMAEPELEEKLRRIDPPLDIAWDRTIAWLSLGVAVAIVLWLMLTPAGPA